MKPFTKSRACRSRRACAPCRDTSPNGQAFRQSLLPIFTVPGNVRDFACPYGVAWDSSGKSRGLGDSIARIAGAVGISPCGGCKDRQATLNKLVPYGEGKAMTRRFAPPGGFLMGAAYIEFSPGQTGVYVWKDGTRLHDPKKKISRALRLVRRGTWFELPTGNKEG